MIRRVLTVVELVAAFAAVVVALVAVMAWVT